MTHAARAFLPIDVRTYVDIHARTGQHDCTLASPRAVGLNPLSELGHAVLNAILLHLACHPRHITLGPIQYGRSSPCPALYNHGYTARQKYSAWRKW